MKPQAIFFGGFQKWRKFPFRATLKIRIFQPPKNTLDSSVDNIEKGFTEVTIKIPNHLIAGIDQLKNEWGLNNRGSVFERLLEVILEKE